MRFLAITFFWVKYEKILAYNIHESVNFDTIYVFASRVVFNFEI